MDYEKAWQALKVTISSYILFKASEGDESVKPLNTILRIMENYEKVKR